MITNAEFVSRVLGGFKVLTKDGHISRRYVLSIGTSLVQTLISQKLDEMTLFKEDGIIRTLKCFGMENIESIECCIVEFKHCKNIMKSTHKLPKTLFGKNGSSIVDVLKIDDGFVFDYQTPRDAVNRKKRKYTVTNKEFYTINDGYLYLPDSEIELLNLRLITPNLWELDEKSNCSTEKCKSYWDYDFLCPDRFLQTVIDKAITELASIYRTSVEDTNPNLDENSKGKTQA